MVLIGVATSHINEGKFITIKQISWCWTRSIVLTYFQDHYVEASIDE